MTLIGKKVLSTALIASLSIFFTGFNSFAQNTQENIKDQVPSQPKQQKEPENKPNISPEELVSIPAKIISVDVNVDKDQKSYIVKCIGTIQNNTNLLLKNIKINVQLLNSDKNIIEETPVENIERLEANQEKPFRIEKFVNTKESPFDIRATSKIVSLEKTNLIEISRWFLDAKKENIIFWNIPYSEQDFMNESTLRNAAIRVLLDVPENDRNYSKATDLINELHYTEGLYAINLSDYENGFINLAAVHPKKKFGEKADISLLSFRNKMVFEKAKALIANKDYQRAVNLLRSISPKSNMYDEAKKELNKLSFLLRTVKPYNLPDISNYSNDQQKIIMLMEEKPQYILVNAPFKNTNTWVFPDFSRFIFNINGELLTYKIYPLF